MGRGFTPGGLLKTVLDIEELRRQEEQQEDDDQLVDRVAQDIPDHGPRDQRLVAAVRFPCQQVICGGFRGQRQGRERVHDEVDPQELGARQRTDLQRQLG